MIELRGVRKQYPGGHVAVGDLTLTIPAATTVALVGPSGCGKTTTLKLINRLVAPTAGQIVIDGQDTARMEPIALRRGMGYVVQEAGLFPHMTVADNVALVPQLLGWPEARRQARVAEMLAFVGLDPRTHASRYPLELSGGQRQRVGFARALAADPPILLMDEPFGALDPLSRRRLQREFGAWKARLLKTVVLVTHDVDEAFALADRIAVLSDGRLLQVGSAAEIRAAPASDFVASFLGLAP